MTAFLLAALSGGNATLAKADGGSLPVIAEGTIGPGTTPATSQRTWFQSYATGNNNNDGLTAATAVKTAAEIKRRWQGGVAGTRVQLPAITITITGLDSAPDNTDPWSVLLDVDQLGPGQLILQCADQAPSHTGTLSSASAFARTSAAGQIIITAADAPNWNLFPMPSLFLDTTAGGVGWLYEPLSVASANGNVSPNRSAATPGTTADAARTVSTADNYQLVPLVSIFMGSGATYRCSPAQPAANNCVATVRRMRLIKSPAASFDTIQIVPQNFAAIFVQECQIDAEWEMVNFTVLQNCWSTSFLGASTYAQQNSCFLLAGGSYAGLSIASGVCVISNDYVFDTASNGGTAFFYTRGQSALIRIGTCSTWGLAQACSLVTGSLLRIAGFTASDILYGKVGGANPIFNANGNAVVQARAGDATWSSAFNLDSTSFLFNSSNSAFGFNTATGVYVGPTTLTNAHMDAALAAGTGFGSQAVAPNLGTGASTANGA